MVSTDKVGFGLLCDTPVLLQVFNLVRVGSSKIRHHASVVPGDNDSASSRWLLLVVAVLDSESCLLVRLLEDIRVLVLTDTAEKDYRVRLQKVLSNKTHCQRRFLLAHLFAGGAASNLAPPMTFRCTTAGMPMNLAARR